MDQVVNKRYDAAFKAQILKEIKETGNAALVARSHNLGYQTVMGWVRSEREAPKKRHKKEQQDQAIRLQKLELENRVLKELLKKTNQIWLSDDLSQQSS